MNKQQRKALIVLTLTVIILASMMPLTAQAKKKDHSGKESRKVLKRVKKRGFIVEDDLGGLIRYREFIKHDTADLLTGYQGAPPIDLEQLPEVIYYVVNVYAIETGDSVILIDAGHEMLAKRLYSRLKKEFGKKPITVLLTHGHADHAGGGRYLQKRGATVYVHPYDYKMVLDGYESEYSPDAFKYRGYSAINYTSNIMNGFMILSTPGHTFGSVSILQQETGKLFTGDLTITMFEEIPPNDFTSELAYFTLLNRPEFMQTMQKNTLYGLMTTLGSYEGIYSGHNGPYIGIGAMSGVIGVTISAIDGTLPLP